VKPSRKRILFLWSAIEEWLYNPHQHVSKKSKTINRPKNQSLIAI
jgi:hypothetical protein